VELRIVDPSGAEVPAGQVGEITVRSPSTMTGYLHQPEETSAVLQPDGWLRTGDAGSVDGDGFLYVRDRIKEMIITGGENVYPAEVENVLAGHPAVAGVAVIGVPSPRWGQEIRAVIELNAGAQVTEQDLLGWARERLAGYKLPKTIAFAESLPRNATGKVVKGEVRRVYGQPAAPLI
jgi:acyl-CoA synthetase (AMP-forming)/AMP-acid ligase II